MSVAILHAASDNGITSVNSLVPSGAQSWGRLTIGTTGTSPKPCSSRVISRHPVPSAAYVVVTSGR
jgi:hypothetical protein